jgi:hypothetical protein
MNIVTNEIINLGHILARKPRTLTKRCVRHTFRVLFILFAVMLASIVMKIGAKPPPTSHNVVEKTIRAHAPYFLSMNAAAHVVTKMPRIIARMPVTQRVGTIVKAR